jgi:hypothetical protein
VANKTVSGEENPTFPAEGRIFPDESLLREFSISEICRVGSAETGCVFAETGSTPLSGVIPGSRSEFARSSRVQDAGRVADIAKLPLCAVRSDRPAFFVTHATPSRSEVSGEEIRHFRSNGRFFGPTFRGRVRYAVHDRRTRALTFANPGGRPAGGYTQPSLLLGP